MKKYKKLMNSKWAQTSPNLKFYFIKIAPRTAYTGLWSWQAKALELELQSRFRKNISGHLLLTQFHLIQSYLMQWV